MSEYSPVVEKIVGDYLSRLAAHLKAVPHSEHQEIIKEVQSHIYEAFRDEIGPDEVDRILSVLKKLGEPFEVASTRVPQKMVDIGRRKKLPLYILAGVGVLLFGLPLGLTGVAIVISLFASVFAILVSLGAVGIGFGTSGLACIVLGILMVFYPEFVSKLVAMGYVQLNWELIGLDQLPMAYQGILVILLGLILAAVGLGILWLSKYFFKGLSYLTLILWKKIQEVVARQKKPTA